MKYVGKSSINTDKNNAATLKSSIQAAVADYQADGNTLSDDVTFTVNGGVSPAAISSDTELADKIKEVTAEDYPKTQSDKNGFTVEISSNGAVTVSCGALTKE